MLVVAYTIFVRVKFAIEYIVRVKEFLSIKVASIYIGNEDRK